MKNGIEIRGLAQFVTNLTKAAKEVPDEAVTRKVRMLALQVLRALMKVSPVDTGLFRASWMIGVNAPPGLGDALAGVKGTASKNGAVRFSSAATEAQAGSLARLKVGDTVFISNPLPYARRLNEGWSTQAPAGFVQLVLAAVLASDSAIGLMAGND